MYWNPNKDYVANHYDLKNNISHNPEYMQSNFILLLKTPIEESISDRFSIIEDLGQHSHEVSTHIERKIFIYLASGFKGYTPN